MRWIMKWIKTEWMRKSRHKKNALFYFLFFTLLASLLYSQYLIMVNQGKAHKIEVLREIATKEKSIINLQDSIIYELKDSINSLNYEE